MDEALLLWIVQQWTHPLGDYFFGWVSARGAFAFPLLLVLLCDGWRRAGWAGARLCLLLIATVVFCDQLGTVLKTLLDEPRPCIVMSAQGLASLGDPELCQRPPNGMPSNHAMSFFAVATLVSLATPWRGWSLGLTIVAFLVGLSRVYLGKHYPSQVLVGSLLGIFIGLLGAYITHYYHLAIRRASNPVTPPDESVDPLRVPAPP